MPLDENDEKIFKDELNKFNEIINKDSEASETIDTSKDEGIKKTIIKWIQMKNY